MKHLHYWLWLRSLWVLRMCWYKLDLSVKELLQWGQLKGFMFLWIFWWVSNNFESWKPFPQIWHCHFFSLSATCRFMKCLFMAIRLLKVLSQLGHSILIPECSIFIWLGSDIFLRSLPQMLQRTLSFSFSSWITLTCCFKSTKYFPQSVHNSLSFSSFFGLFRIIPWEYIRCFRCSVELRKDSWQLSTSQRNSFLWSFWWDFKAFDVPKCLPHSSQKKGRVESSLPVLTQNLQTFLCLWYCS